MEAGTDIYWGLVVENASGLNADIILQGCKVMIGRSLNLLLIARMTFVLNVE